MKKILILCIAMLIYSCNKSQVTIQNNKTEDNTEIKLKDSMQSKYITYESIKNLSPGEVVPRFKPVSDETFILGREDGFITEFRAGLANIFKEEDIKIRNIKIREITWKASEKQNLTVWYHKRENQWIPIDHYLWDKDSEF